VVVPALTPPVIRMYPRYWRVAVATPVLSEEIVGVTVLVTFWFRELMIE
jgi:hypothetical protein